METVKSMIKLGKVLLHYLTKKNFQSITTKTNLIETDCLVVSLNLATGTLSFLTCWQQTTLHQPLSNHTPTIIKQLFKIISKRIWDLSYNEEELHETKSLYETALKDGEKRQ